MGCGNQQARPRSVCAGSWAKWICTEVRLLGLLVTTIVWGQAVWAQQSPINGQPVEPAAPASADRQAGGGGQLVQWPEAFRRDANLYDVHFVDRHDGWAVGDRGTILRTQNGGDDWRVCRSGVDGRLEAVFFIDRRHGWAVGGRTIPGSHRNRAILLKTNDGGETWSQPEDGFLPWLTGIYFRSDEHGYAWGLPSQMYPSAMFVTDDGGGHWTPLAGHTSGWIDATFERSSVNRHGRDRAVEGWLLDRDGNLSSARDGQLSFLGRADALSRRPRCIASSGRARQWLGGNRGWLRTRPDGGSQWAPPSHLPDGLPLVEFDWRAIASAGDSIWVAGAPGTRVLHSVDGGQHWQVVETGQSLPLNSMQFVDRNTGWAVGALGTILHTTDGGRTWHAQQAGDRRLAAMVVFDQPANLVWELVAQLAAGEGYRVGIEVLTTDTSLRHVSGQTPTATRLDEATTMLGGAGANMIESLESPAAQAGWSVDQIGRKWNRGKASECLNQLTAYLARQFRIWRPELVVMPTIDIAAQASDSPSPPSGAHFVQQVVLRAVEMAADANQFPNHGQAGLKAWRVGRVTSFGEDRGGAGYSVSSARMLPVAGYTVEQMAQFAGSIVSDRPRILGVVETLSEQGERPRHWRIRIPGGAAKHSSSKLLPAATVATADMGRALQYPADGRVAVQQKHAQRLRNLETLLRGSQNMDAAVWKQAMHLADKLPWDLQGELFYRSAAGGLRLGHGAVASRHLQALAFDPRPHRLQEAARLQLFWLLTSQEAAMHWPLAPLDSQAGVYVEQLKKSSGSGQLARAAYFDSTSSARGTAPSANASHRSPVGAVVNHVVVGGHGMRLGPQSRRSPVTGARPTRANAPSALAASRHAGATVDVPQQRQRQLDRLLSLIQRQQPDLYREGLIRFPLAAYQFRTNEPDKAIQFWKGQLAGRISPAYRTWAASELALLKANSVPPKPLWQCAPTLTRPHLDGQLEAQVWKHASVVQLDESLDDSSLMTEVRLLYDSQYLYLAATCKKDAEGDYSSRRAARQRDQALRDDRLELFIDIDRDAMTAWRLTIDHRGWAVDALNGDLSWDPIWYIAAAQDQQQWSIEVAMPLSELSDSPVDAGTVWGLGMQRIAPGADWQTWRQRPPVQAYPEEFGLLQFGADRNRNRLGKQDGLSDRDR